MSTLSRKLVQTDDADGARRLTYWCQGCDEVHGVIVQGGKPGQSWGWDGNVEKPVFTPSVLYRRQMWTPPVTPENIEQWRAAPWEQVQKEHICHTFIGCNGAQPGEVIFLGDCTHALAGTVQPLLDLPAYWLDIK